MDALLSTTLTQTTIPAETWMAARSNLTNWASWLGGAGLLTGLVLLVSLVFQVPGPWFLTCAAAAAVLIPMGAWILFLAVNGRWTKVTVDGESLAIHSLLWDAMLPIEAIEGIWSGQRLPVGAIGALSTFRAWRGARVPAGDYGFLRLAGPPMEPSLITVVTTPEIGVVLATERPAELRARLIERAQALAPPAAGPLAHARIQLRSIGAALEDPFAPWCLAAAEAVLLVGLAIYCWQYPTLPARMALRFDAAGAPIDAGTPETILRLPIGGLLILLVNWALALWLYGRGPLLGRLLWFGAVIAEIAVALAIRGLVK